MQTLRKRTDLSVIIPVYNLQHYLDPMLRSLAEQDLAGYTIEIIFVLNNCTDRSEDVIRNSGLDCTILNCATQGCGPARNMGLDVAVGKYIWMMDGDDWLTTNDAIRKVLDRIYDRYNILRVPFQSNLFGGSYYSMVWQYVFNHDYIKGIRFPDYQPGEDGAFMDDVFRKIGYNQGNYLRKPHMDETLYFYNYMRSGSNMYRFLRLHEKI